MLKKRIAKAQGIFSQLKKSLEEQEDKSAKLRLEYWTGTVMTEVKYDSEAWAL